MGIPRFWMDDILLSYVSSQTHNFIKYPFKLKHDIDLPMTISLYMHIPVKSTANPINCK